MLINEMTKINIKKKRILIRLDLNVPIKNNKITSYARIKSSLPTIKFALKNKSKIILLSHLGRPKEGKYEKKIFIISNISIFKKKIKKYNYTFF